MKRRGCWQCRRPSALLFRKGSRSYCGSCYSIVTASSSLALPRLLREQERLHPDHPRQPLIAKAIARCSKQPRKPPPKPEPRPERAGVRLPRGPKPTQEELVEMYDDFSGS